jgi:hypothetical protein
MVKTKVQKVRYYHITSFQGWLAIKDKGLKASEDGYIYMLDDDKVATYVALHQLGIPEFGLFEIDPSGIKGKLEPDLVGELTAKHQYRVKQGIIDKKYLKNLGMKHGIGPKNGSPY